MVVMETDHTNSGGFLADYELDLLSVDCRGIEPRFPGCKPSVLPLDEQPDRVIPDGIEPPLPACRTGVVPLDHGIELSVTEVGVEPTKSSGSRPDRFSCLHTRSSGNGRSRCRTWLSRLMRPRWALAHRRWLFAVAGPGIEPDVPAL